MKIALEDPRSQSDVALLAQADMLLVLIDLLRSPAQEIWPREPMPDEPSLLDVIASAELDSLDGDTSALADALLSAVREAHRIDVGALSDEHHRLFEGAMPCPLNETAYVRRDKGALIGDLAGFYRAFGFVPESRSGEKADHLLTELEWVAALLIMCAEADDEEQRLVARSALCAFAIAHPADWMGAVCERLGELTILPLFRYAADALKLLWDRLVSVHAWPVTPATATLTAPADEPESPYECGAPGAEQLVSLHAGGREL